MKKLKNIALIVSCCISICSSTIYADALPDQDDLNANYASQRQTAIDDKSLFQEFAVRSDILDYFVSADPRYSNEHYDSNLMLNESETLALGFNIRTSNYAVIYSKTPEAAETVSEILKKYFPEDLDGGFRIDSTDTTCFHVRDRQRDEFDEKKMKATFDAIYQELSEADLIDTGNFYYPGQVYEHHELYIPYLTGYYSSKNPNNTTYALTPELLQEYIEEHDLPCTVQIEEKKSSFMYNIVPNEKMDFEEHFKLALQLRDDLGLIPYAYDDDFKSWFPPIFAKKGDSNANGEVDIADAVMTVKYLLCDGDITDYYAGDMNSDGAVNAVDFTLLKQQLLRSASE